MYKPTEYQDQIYFCTKEYNLSLWQQASEIITNPSYTPFKRKITKKIQSIVCNSPHTDHLFELLKVIQPVDAQYLTHKSFKLSESIKAIYEEYKKFGYNLPEPINPLYLNQPTYINYIYQPVINFINEVKLHSTNKKAIADRNTRKDLINEIKKKNIKVMKKLFKTKQQFNLNVFTYVFNMEQCISQDKPFIEQALTQQISRMIDKFNENYKSEILELFFQLQRDLSKNYVLNVYSATESECEPLSMQDFIPQKNGNFFIAPQINITLKTSETLWSMNIQDVNGLNEKRWKAIFSELLAKYHYVYYESEYVSPKFNYKDCSINY